MIHPTQRLGYALLLALGLACAPAWAVVVDFNEDIDFGEFDAITASADKSATGGLGGTPGVDLPSGSFNNFNGPRGSTQVVDFSRTGASYTVGTFFNLSALADGEFLRLGIAPLDSNFANKPFASVHLAGTSATLVARDDANIAPAATLSLGSWYYFEVSMTRVDGYDDGLGGDTNEVAYHMLLAAADNSGQIGDILTSRSLLSTAQLDAEALNNIFGAAFKLQGDQTAIMDNAYASDRGTSQVPEPGALVLIGIGATLLLPSRRFRGKNRPF